ncbi:hypothetical protein MRB53_015589 [Persea americana]|uniref:Uncharacterized protein n=1 Tax=Persea americana TaxID=3435 RepID=A0ACC2LZT6_PERAE|nr:hypothetical protein MRB53_015589 [Persea americana]
MITAVTLKFPDFLLSERRKRGNAVLPPMSGAVWLQFPDLLLSEGRKPENAGLPPMRAAVKLQLPAFLLSELGKRGKCKFAAHASSGKAA